MTYLLSDEEMLDLIRLHKDRGFRALVGQYQRNVYWQVRTIVGNHDDADDVVQNVFIKIYKSLDRFEAQSKLSTWMYRIAVNESLTLLKSKARRKEGSIDDNIMEVTEIMAEVDTMRSEDTLQILEKAITSLPDRQKAVFSLRYYDEMPYEQMSNILDTSVGALKASYHHAVKKIENFIKNEGRN